jgi:hypothetical protein
MYNALNTIYQICICLLRLDVDLALNDLQIQHVQTLQWSKGSADALIMIPEYSSKWLSQSGEKTFSPSSMDASSIRILSELQL